MGFWFGFDYFWFDFISCFGFVFFVLVVVFSCFLGGVYLISGLVLQVLNRSIRYHTIIIIYKIIK